MRKPRISIITVTYNSEKHLEKTIKSVLSQDYSNFEYIIIDGQSTDGTIDIIKKYENKIDYWISEPDSGMYEALNKGIQYSTGDIIGQLNSDDLYNENVLSIVANIFIKQPFDMLYGDTVLIDSFGKKIGYKKAMAWGNMYFRNHEFLHSACFFSRLILKKLNGYSTDYKIASDIDLFQRVFLNTEDIIIENKPFSLQRKGGMSHSGLGPYIGYWEYRNISVKNGCGKVKATSYYLLKVILRVIFRIRDYLKDKILSLKV
jgi:glycosyltransferase involved in cell wall biosynthesis